MSRDWQKDMEMCGHHVQPLVFAYEAREALPYWLQQYAAEKERADKAEHREKKLQELLNDALGCMIIFAGFDNEHVTRIAEGFRSLYPLPERNEEA